MFQDHNIAKNCWGFNTMKFFGIGKELVQKKATKFKNIQELTAEERAWIEDLDKDGARASEIAENLGLDVRTIYNYRRVLNEKERRQPINPVVDVQKNKDQQMDQIKANLEIQLYFYAVMIYVFFLLILVLFVLFKALFG